MIITLFAALFIMFIADASASNETTFPLEQRVQLSNNLTVHIIQVTVSNVTYGGAYSSDPEHSVWPIVVFQYENNGNVPLPSRLHVRFVDNESKSYDQVSESMELVLPGKTYAPAMIEVAIPQNRFLTELVIVDDSIDQKTVTREISIPIPNATPTPEPTASTPGISDISIGDNVFTIALIPIILAGIGLAGWLMARKLL